MLLLLKLNAILSLGICAASGVVFRSVEARRSCASESLLLGDGRAVVKECRGADSGHRGNGKEAWSRIVNAEHERAGGEDAASKWQLNLRDSASNHSSVYILILML